MSTEYPTNNLPEHEGTATTPLFDEITHTHLDGEQTDNSGKADLAKDEAKAVAGDAKDAAQDVAASAKEKAADVASEAKGQAKGLLEEATGELREQAGTQKKRAAEQLHSVGEQLNSMANSSEDSGPAVDLVRNLGGRAGAVASWLGDRDTDQVLADVRAYASRNPGTFIGIAAVAGILAGRLSKSLAANAKDDSESSSPASARNTSSASEASSSVSTMHTPTPEFGDSRAQTASITAASDKVSTGGPVSGDTVYKADIDFDRRGGTL
ncbi:hypothetical protein [Glaciihabitans sp. UYNi722]|uniref:hypothetical protein n=1 Tax=Glaciihabitans sp. UYNi722 TaxID=3156344 RepID=UPI003393B885